MARVEVAAYCRDPAGLSLLAELLGGSPYLDLRESVDTASGLAAAAQRGHGRVGVARLQQAADELPLLGAHCEGLPLVLLVPDPRALAARALQAGAGAVLELAPPAERLGAAVLSVAQGLVVLPADAAGDSRIELAAPPEPLTPRELEILSLLAGGDSNKTIAARLAISVHTVKFHVASIFSKLGVSSRTEAVTLGLRLGIVLL